jgi:hypothetical protein
MTPASPAPNPIELQASLGLPAEQLWDHYVQYSRRAELVVLSAVISRDRIPYSLLYVRGLQEERYRPAVVFPDDGYSMESPILSDDPPYVFYVLSRWVRSGADFVCQYKGVGRLHLGVNSEELWETDLPGPTRFFVSELAGVSPNGQLVYAVCGFPPPDGVGPVDYVMTELNWERKSITRKTAFKWPFF